MKAPSTAARVTVALCSLAMAAVDGVRAKAGVAARMRRTWKDRLETFKVYKKISWLDFLSINDFETATFQEWIWLC